MDPVRVNVRSDRASSPARFSNRICYDKGMTSKEYLKKLQDPLWYGEQDANGVDLSLIRENLRLSPTERLRRADQSRVAVLRLKSHVRRIPEERSREDR